MITRRHFISNSGKFLVLSSMGNSFLFSKNHYSRDSSGEYPFNLGIAGYTFINFDIDFSLKMMNKVNVHYLCIKDFHLPYDSNDEQIATFKAKLKNAGVIGYAVGPVGSEISIDKAFKYAQRVGVKLITGIPALSDLPVINEKVKEYDIKYAIHNHGPDEKNYTDATAVYNLVKDLDPRIGLCLDIGHNMRFGSDPVSDMEKYAQKIFDIHLKDVTSASKEGRACELGRGIINIADFVRMLKKVGYRGCCSIEYEKDMDDPLAGIAESVGYFKGVCDGLMVKKTLSYADSKN